jgi:LAS superfamily LD-carboxypeptidase LdcB
LQESLLHSFCKKNQCAQAWSSEHQAGLALDLSVKTARWWSVGLDQNNKYHDWLLDHAAEFGFENTYQKWVDIDGKRIEPRHRRYVWSQLATLLHDRQQTFAERIVSGSNQISCPGLNDIIIK